MLYLINSKTKQLNKSNLNLTLKHFYSLIQAGANIEIRNARQWTPLDCAAAYGHHKVARILLEAGASIQPKKKIKVRSKLFTENRFLLGFWNVNVE